MRAADDEGAGRSLAHIAGTPQMSMLQGHEIQLGWSVVRHEPWHFVGLFATEAEARDKADEMGPDYIARYGERQEDTFSFHARDGGGNMMAGSIFASSRNDTWLD
ncbi:hypothetical protein [Sphingomonas immobilis]|jgi:hypothetical protein|nr:hypothetical protein [Sphingomonas sp. CA1-15]